MARRVVVAALVLVGLMALGGYFGYSQGYDAGLASDGGRDGFSAFFLGIGLLFKFLLVFFLVSLIAKLFFFRRWARHGGGGRRGHGHWHRHHGEHQDDDEPIREPDEGDRPQVA